MTLPDHLRDVLHDDAWALPVPPNTMDLVRKGRRQRRLRNGLVTGTLGIALVAGAVAVASQVASSQTTLSQYADGFAAGQPVPGIDPDWTPTSGRDWLLTEAQLREFEGSHQVPSQGLYGKSASAPSPAPITSITDELQAYADGAGLPTGSTFTSDEAYDHDARISVLHVTLPSGAPVWLQRTRLSKPEATSFGEDPNRLSASPVVDISGTTAAMVTYEDFHFGFGSFYNAMGVAHAAKVVTVGGVEWTWIAPHPVPVSQLTTWAIAAAQR